MGRIKPYRLIGPGLLIRLLVQTFLIWIDPFACPPTNYNQPFYPILLFQRLHHFGKSEIKKQGFGATIRKDKGQLHG